MRSPVLLIPALLLASCNQPGEAKAPAPTATSADRASPALPAQAATTAAARKVSEENDLYSFDYSYPAAAAAIPSLKAFLDADLDKQKDELVASAEEAKQNAADGPIGYYPYNRSSEWQVVTNTRGWLSLSANLYEFAGGAHGNSWFDTILWDKQANRQREPADLFVSRAALTRAIQPEFCRQIDRQRAEKRGEPVVRGSGDSYDECLDPLESIVILGSSNGKAFNRIGVLVAPYNAGPYVEGSYEATIPVNAAVLAAVKPEFRSSFATAR